MNLKIILHIKATFTIPIQNDLDDKDEIPLNNLKNVNSQMEDDYGTYNNKQFTNEEDVINSFVINEARSNLQENLLANGVQVIVAAKNKTPNESNIRHKLSTENLNSRSLSCTRPNLEPSKTLSHIVKENSEVSE